MTSLKDRLRETREGRADETFAAGVEAAVRAAEARSRRRRWALAVLAVAGAVVFGSLALWLTGRIMPPTGAPEPGLIDLVIVWASQGLAGVVCLLALAAALNALLRR